MFNIGPGELMAIAAVALIVLGPQRLPQALRQVGRVIGELRRISSGFQDELRRAVDESEILSPVDDDADGRRTPAAIDVASNEATAARATTTDDTEGRAASKSAEDADDVDEDDVEILEGAAIPDAAESAASSPASAPSDADDDDEPEPMLLPTSLPDAEEPSTNGEAAGDDERAVS